MHRTSGIDFDPIYREAFVPLDGRLDHGETVGRCRPDARCLFVRRDAAWHEHDVRKVELGHDLLCNDHVPLMHGVEGPAEDPYSHVHLTARLTGSRTPSRRS